MAVLVGCTATRFSIFYERMCGMSHGCNLTMEGVEWRAERLRETSGLATQNFLPARACLAPEAHLRSCSFRDDSV